MRSFAGVRLKSDPSEAIKRAVVKPDDEAEDGKENEAEDEKENETKTEVKQIKMVLGSVIDTTPKEPDEQQVEKPKVR